ncbi:MAG: dTDP-4-dehydrorhamnose 3,5-epimerase [Cyanobacteria bacterium REEB459]|nr:dTDP-4-dehydrorhamnose 3,5-epimerase [Cyanobacteria bacterium REEB459]
MIINSTEITDVLLVKPKVFEDDRGFFMESFNQQVFADKTGLTMNFVQDNHSRSSQGVLRGLHYQLHQPQGKLVRVVVGEILDVVVDIRRSSPTFGLFITERLSAANKHQLWIPPGMAHGFVVLSESAEMIYKTTEYYAPTYERSIRWDDPDLAIDWQLPMTPILSAKDQAGAWFKEAEVFE